MKQEFKGARYLSTLIFAGEFSIGFLSDLLQYLTVDLVILFKRRRSLMTRPYTEAIY